METATDALLLDSPDPGEQAVTYLVVRGQNEARLAELAAGIETVVGRADGATLRLDDSSVSRRHSRLYWREGALYVEDLRSRNGTLVNGKTVAMPTRLAGGDRLGIGRFELLVASRSPSGSSQAEAFSGDDVVIADAAMAKVFKVAQRLATVPTAVLLLGETGVGKEVVAEKIHQWGPRVDGPFIRVNCAALTESLAESELFGHERGAFTGAEQRRLGYVEAAAGGTLLLDEIGELSPKVQAKLLLTLENRTITRVGASRETPVDVRVVCATHRDLASEIGAGRFRPDLYYRISAFTLTIPPLRERPGEIQLLATLFARRVATSMGDSVVPHIEPEAMAALLSYQWPGNVRELRNAIEYAMVLADSGALGREHLPPSVFSSAPIAGPGVDGELSGLEQRRIEEALVAEGGNQTRAAVRLGITRRALIYRLHKHGIDKRQS